MVENIYTLVGEVLSNLGKHNFAYVEDTDEFNKKEILYHVEKMINDEKGSYNIRDGHFENTVIIEFI